MIGDQDDFCGRLRLTLPNRWFSDAAPVLDGLLSGFASVWETLFGLLQFIIQQSRLRTASGAFLELAAQDYLSLPLPRRLAEDDGAYRTRLLAAIQRMRATPSSIVAAAAAAGYSLTIFEAAQPVDTGAYNIAESLSWSCAGAWGSLQMPLESLLVATPGSDPHEGELWSSLATAAPAGGALWLAVAKSP